MSSAKNTKRDHYVAPRRTLLLAIAFCLVFAFVGIHQITVSLIPLTWRSVDCVVQECKLTDQSENALPFSARVLFEFESDGKTYRSSDLGIDGWKKAEHAIEFQLSLEQKQFSTKAYLPSGNPNQAVLVRPEPRWGGMAFVLFGAGISWLLIMADRYRNAPSEIVSRKTAPAIALLFGGMGIFMLVTMSIPAWIESVCIHRWQKIPATIVWSRVRAKSDSSNTSDQPDICYEYCVGNRSWRNNRLGMALSTGSDSAHELVSKHPAGKRTTCRIHPTNPAKTYLITKGSWHILLTLFPLPFLFVGYLCVRSLLKKSSWHASSGSPS